MTDRVEKLARDIQEYVDVILLSAHNNEALREASRALQEDSRKLAEDKTLQGPVQKELERLEFETSGTLPIIKIDKLGKINAFVQTENGRGCAEKYISISPHEKVSSTGKDSAALIESVTAEEKLLSNRIIKILGRTFEGEEYSSDSAVALQKISIFKKKAKARGLSDKEIALTLHELNALVSDDKQAQIKLTDRAKLVSQILADAAYPTEITQDRHNTCTMTTVEKIIYWSRPSKIAEMVREAVLTGKYTYMDSHQTTFTVKLPPSSFHPSLDAPASVESAGSRGLSSEILQVTLINMASQRRFPPQTYEQGQPTDNTDTGERLYDSNNVIVKDANGKPTNYPNVTLSEMASVLEQLTGKTGMVLAHKEQNNENGVVHFGSSGELQNILTEKTKRTPVILLVDLANRQAQRIPFFSTEHAWHVITIHGVKGEKALVNDQVMFVPSKEWIPISRLYKMSNSEG